ncbi:MAG TPA: PQQ-binding-like beta-propeller repeat protein [Gaiellaceae bacterium]|nr:PQQ-binding-like beta-propeller repeat protein [Gaiellaceae bacterium]
MRRLVIPVALAGLAAVAAGSATTATKLGGDWTRFGYDAARSSSGPAQTGITAANLGKLRRGQTQLGGTADSSPIYLRAVRVGGKTRDVFFLTTSYGKAVAVDASSGRVLWTFTPPGYSTWAGNDQITNSTPVADPSRRWIYSAAPNGKIHKLAVATGREAPGWPVTITKLATREKIGVALNYSRGLVLAATGGYFGDAPPYQGHVAAISASFGRLVHVWNSLCSDRHALISPPTCSASDSAIWARSGVVVEPGSGKLLVATGNGPWDGKTNWGDSVLELSPDASTLLQNWTPTDQQGLNQGDVDLGSTAPALLGNGLAVQSGKDGKLRLLDLTKLNGKGGAAPVLGGELQTLSTPSGSGLFSAPAGWRHGGKTWLFVSDFSASAAYVLNGRRLSEVWNVTPGGTSPVVAGGLLYVYDASGTLRIYAPTTGKLLVSLDAGRGHWSSPIVTDGRVALPVGDANDHRLSGTLDIWRLRG